MADWDINQSYSVSDQYMALDGSNRIKFKSIHQFITKWNFKYYNIIHVNGLYWKLWHGNDEKLNLWRRRFVISCRNESRILNLDPVSRTTVSIYRQDAVCSILYAVEMNPEYAMRTRHRSQLSVGPWPWKYLSQMNLYLFYSCNNSLLFCAFENHRLQS